MVYSAVVKDYDTAWSRVGCDLRSLLKFSTNAIVERKRRTRSSRKDINFSLLTEPSNMSRAIIPSQVRAGRIE